MVPDPVLLWALFVFVCAFLPFLTWFCFFLVCFLKRERKEGCGLGRWGGAWDMGGVGREENLIRMYCIVLKNFNKNVWKKEFFVSRYRIESSLHRTVQSWSLATLTLLALINRIFLILPCVITGSDIMLTLKKQGYSSTVCGFCLRWLLHGHRYPLHQPQDLVCKWRIHFGATRITRKSSQLQIPGFHFQNFGFPASNIWPEKPENLYF